MYVCILLQTYSLSNIPVLVNYGHKTFISSSINLVCCIGFASHAPTICISFSSQYWSGKKEGSRQIVNSFRFPDRMLKILNNL